MARARMATVILDSNEAVVLSKVFLLYQTDESYTHTLQLSLLPTGRDVGKREIDGGMPRRIKLPASWAYQR